MRSGRLRKCNRKPKEGLGVRLTPGFSEHVFRGTGVNRSAISLLLATLLLSGESAVAQTTPADPAAPAQANPPGTTTPESATSGIGRGDHAGDRAIEGRTAEDGNSPPANPPAKDETVGVGGSVDRAPRDIREPFDE